MPISNDSTETIVHRWCCWCLSAIVCKIQMFVSIRLPNQTISNSLYATTIFPYCFNSIFSALFCDSFSKLHVQLEYKLVLAQRKKRSSTKSSNTFRCGVCIEKSRTKPSSQMAENNFNFLQNIPICIEEEEELLLTALENGSADNDHGKMKKKKKLHKNIQMHTCLLSGEFAWYFLNISIPKVFSSNLCMQSLNIRSIWTIINCQMSKDCQRKRTTKTKGNMNECWN